jgi:hypothetical protein
MSTSANRWLHKLLFIGRLGTLNLYWLADFLLPSRNKNQNNIKYYNGFHMNHLYGINNLNTIIINNYSYGETAIVFLYNYNTL